MIDLPLGDSRALRARDRLRSAARLQRARGATNLRPVSSPDRTSDTSAAIRDDYSEAELRAYVRRSLALTLLGLVGLVGAVGYLSLRYEPELLTITRQIYQGVGFVGLMAILFLSDSVITPIPPDALLVVISKSPLHSHWPPVILFVGCFSAVAGCVGFYLGKHAGRSRPATFLLNRAGPKLKATVARYGKWAVALGAITPIPFSITCWFAGIGRVPFASFAPMTLLRIPRFFLYYLAIAYGDQILRALKH